MEEPVSPPANVALYLPLTADRKTSLGALPKPGLIWTVMSQRPPRGKGVVGGNCGGPARDPPANLTLEIREGLPTILQLPVRKDDTSAGPSLAKSSPSASP
jgi:hypothetical protein